MRNILYAFIVVVVIIGAVVLLKKDTSEVVSNNTTIGDTAEAQRFTFDVPKKSAHYESNTPKHGSVLAAPPINIVIDFNFDLAKPSNISIIHNEKEYGAGETTIDVNKLSMRRNLSSDTPNGLYKVIYKACWPDGSCHDGRFEFAIERGEAAAYENMLGKNEITIRMSEIMFKPRNVKISPGTTVTWINDEDVDHYVNTETHPAHTYFSPQNSRAIKKGESFKTIFNIPGIYPYHCSAHADVMMGNILVEG
jgi:plastocyanin